RLDGCQGPLRVVGALESWTQFQRVLKRLFRVLGVSVLQVRETQMVMHHWIGGSLRNAFTQRADRQTRKTFLVVDPAQGVAGLDVLRQASLGQLGQLQRDVEIGAFFRVVPSEIVCGDGRFVVEGERFFVLLARV